MNAQERKTKIESYGSAHQLLVASLERFPREMWQFRPSPDRWSIHEIIVHIADSEVNSYVRCRRFIAEPGGIIQGYDENQWASALRYHDQSPDDALELFRWLRKKTHALIVDLPETAWSTIAHHTEDGEISLEDWLNTYERHVPVHIHQMQGVYDDWFLQKETGEYPPITTPPN